MISKKKVTALALAGLFVTPVLAATEVKYNEIRSDDGYLTAGDMLFSQALENSRNRTDASKDAVELTMWGTHSETRNDGLTELKLSGKTYQDLRQRQLHIVRRQLRAGQRRSSLKFQS